MGGWLNESGFSKEKLCSRAEAEVRNFNFFFFFAEAELRKFKSQYIVLNWETSSHRLFCVRKQNCWTSRHSIFLVRKRNFKSQDILCAEAKLRDLKVKALVWKRNCETSSRTNFQVTVFSLCGSGIAPFQSSQVTHYSVCGTGTAEL